MNRNTPQTLPITNSSDSLGLTEGNVQSFRLFNANQSNTASSNPSSITPSCMVEENAPTNSDHEQTLPVSQTSDALDLDFLDDSFFEEINLDAISSNKPYSPEFFTKDFTHPD